MKPWVHGRSEIDLFIEQRLLGRVSPDRTLADLMLSESDRHLASSRTLTDSDSTGSFALAYDASRKALAAILENQGLRATSRGGHRVVEDSSRAQLVPPQGPEVNGFGWMRKLRNSTEYPSATTPTAGPDDAAHAQGFAEDVISMARSLLDQMPPY